ncbi:sulfurtransferase [Magnetospira sp. QH-2]|uniref:sulfurtransferase n=1 Tax=Magnetospira sp. (strain QH-2) TaxID=1288970 RepID=UPI0003E80F52|nr:rhodanese-like domain-containing protein [Magnetospira sp. QH-2]CCQ74671.1 putative 3-mercaptopyruvate sulfurtransferase [Magnetospira sp. QH-2]
MSPSKIWGPLLAALFVLLPVAVPAAPAFLVNSEWLEEHIDDPDLRILEVRYHPHRYHTIGHIPGAVQVQRFRDLGDNGGNPLMLFPSREAFQATLRRWGIDDGSTVVIYDDSATALASRVYFLLELFGFDMTRVKVLDGGVGAWSGFNDLTKDVPSVAPGTVTLKEADASLYVDWATVYDRVVSSRDPSVVLLDARPESHYSGQDIVHAVRGGHIPGAINVVSLSGTANGEWKDDAALAEMYKAIPKDKTVYAYCHDGFRMGLAYMQLKHLGYGDVRLYNGGWGHWGNRLSLPVVLGTTPFDDAFKL